MRVQKGHESTIQTPRGKVSEPLGDGVGAVTGGCSGRSEEQAEVVYLNKAHALAALKKYNRVCLDGKPMHIELVSQPPAGGRVVEALSSGIRCVFPAPSPSCNALGQSTTPSSHKHGSRTL